MVLTVGTFLAGRIHVGLDNYAGRARRRSAFAAAGRSGCARSRRARGRLKTGTPPRIDGRTHRLLRAWRCSTATRRCRCSRSSAAPSEHPRQLPCHITHTNERTHADHPRRVRPLADVHRRDLGHRARATAPRSRTRSIALPTRARTRSSSSRKGSTRTRSTRTASRPACRSMCSSELVRSIRGFERAHLTRPGYAIEYDFFDPRDLKASLETKSVAGLFFAGQINGTTGYEEAAAQGLLAGINAALHQRAARSLAARSAARPTSACWSMTWSPAGTSEPYRMFTSRAEHRLLLREDNADAASDAARAGAWAWWTMSAGRCSRPSRPRSPAELARLQARRFKPGQIPARLGAARARRGRRRRATSAPSSCCAAPRSATSAADRARSAALAIRPLPTIAWRRRCERDLEVQAQLRRLHRARAAGDRARAPRRSTRRCRRTWTTRALAGLSTRCASSSPQCGRRRSARPRASRGHARGGIDPAGASAPPARSASPERRCAYCPLAPT